MPVITNATSVLQAGTAFTGAGPDTLTVDPGAYLISTGSDGASLNGAWTINVSGVIGSYGALGVGLVQSGAGLVSKISVAAGGEIFGADEAIYALHATNLVNRGAIASSTKEAIHEMALSGDYGIANFGLVLGNTTAIGLVGTGTHTIINRGTISASLNSIDASIFVAGVETVVNTGTLIGGVNLGDGADVFKDTAKVGKVMKHGKVFGIIDLGDGNDTMTGGKFAETVRDGGGADKVMLGSGNDTYLAISITADPDGVDTIDGGAGIDTYDLTGTAAGTQYYVNLDSVSRLTIPATTATTGAFGIPETITNFENVTGGASDDNIAGNKLGNILLGAGGSDFIYGYGGNDTIDAGAGADVLYGGLGKDVLTGGTGPDLFVFDSLAASSALAAGRDAVTDFSHGDGDRLDFSLIDANTKVAGNQDFVLTASNGLGLFTKTAGELRYSLTSAGTIVQGDVNGDGKADFSVALFGNIILQTSDIGL